ELIRCQAPAILVPYPHAADNHQAANAEQLRREQAALVVEQRAVETITGDVIALARDCTRLEEFRRNLRRLERDSPARLIADDLETLYGTLPPRIGWVSAFAA